MFTGANTTAIADTGTSLTLVDDQTCKKIYAAIPRSVFSNAQGGYVFPTKTAETYLPVIGLDIGGKTFNIIKEDLAYADLGNGMTYGGIQSRGDLPFNIYGDSWLKSVYAIFDVGKKRFGCVQRTEPENAQAAAAARPQAAPPAKKDAAAQSGPAGPSAPVIPSHDGAADPRPAERKPDPPKPAAAHEKKSEPAKKPEPEKKADAPKPEEKKSDAPKKADDKPAATAAEKKPEPPKKVDEKKPEEKKTDDKKADDKKADDKKADDKKPEEKKTDDKKADAPKKADDKPAPEKKPDDPAPSAASPPPADSS